MVSGVAQLLNRATCWLLISALDCFYKTHTETLNQLGSGLHRVALILSLWMCPMQNKLAKSACSRHQAVAALHTAAYINFIRV